jgi:hypothetical protein
MHGGSDSKVYDSTRLSVQEQTEVWKKRLALFLQAERSMSRYHVISTISLSLIFAGLGILSFVFYLPQVMPKAILFTCLTVIPLATLTYLFCFALVRASRNHRNELARFFYENNVNIEYHAGVIQLRNRCSSEIICQKNNNE